MVKKEVLILSFIIVFFFHLLSVYAFAPIEQQRDENNPIEQYRNNFPPIDEGTIRLDKGLQTIPYTLVSDVKWGEDGLPTRIIFKGHDVKKNLGVNIMNKDSLISAAQKFLTTYAEELGIDTSQLRIADVYYPSSISSAAVSSSSPNPIASSTITPTPPPSTSPSDYPSQRIGNVIFKQIVRGVDGKEYDVAGSFVVLGFVKGSDGIWRLVESKLNTYDTSIAQEQKPILSQKEAVDKARSYLGNINPAYMSLKEEKVELVAYPVNDGKEVILADKVIFEESDAGGEIEKFTVIVDDNFGQFLNLYDTILKVQVSGRVSGSIYPEIPTKGQKDDVGFKDDYVFISDSQGARAGAITRENGDYKIDINDPQKLESRLGGPWVQSIDARTGKTVSMSRPISEGTNIDYKDYDTSYKQEQSNVFYHANIMHDFAVQPHINAKMNFLMPVYVNYPDSCNAGYNSDHKAIIFFEEGTFEFFFARIDCEATSLFSDIVYHEYAHGITDGFIDLDEEAFPYKGETGNLNEGLSDYVACSVSDQQGDQNPTCMDNYEKGKEGTCFRDCKNNDKYPDDYGEEPHKGMQIISGALWDLRERFIERYKEEGIKKADALIYNALRFQPTSFTTYVKDMILADDDNGDPDDGSPNIEEICNSFIKHGIVSDICLGYSDTPIAIISFPDPKPTVYGQPGFIRDEILPIVGTVYPVKDSSIDEWAITIFDSTEGKNVFEMKEEETNPVIRSRLITYDFSQLIVGHIYTLTLTVRSNGKESSDKINFLKTSYLTINILGQEEKYLQLSLYGRVFPSDSKTKFFPGSNKENRYIICKPNKICEIKLDIVSKDNTDIVILMEVNQKPESLDYYVFSYYSLWFNRYEFPQTEITIDSKKLQQVSSNANEILDKRFTVSDLLDIDIINIIEILTNDNTIFIDTSRGYNKKPEVSLKIYYDNLFYSDYLVYNRITATKTIISFDKIIKGVKIGYVLKYPFSNEAIIDESQLKNIRIKLFNPFTYENFLGSFEYLYNHKKDYVSRIMPVNGFINAPGETMEYNFEILPEINGEKIYYIFSVGSYYVIGLYPARVLWNKYGSSPFDAPSILSENIEFFNDPFALEIKPTEISFKEGRRHVLRGRITDGFKDGKSGIEHDTKSFGKLQFVLPDGSTELIQNSEHSYGDQILGSWIVDCNEGDEPSYYTTSFPYHTILKDKKFCQIGEYKIDWVWGDTEEGNINFFADGRKLESHMTYYFDGQRFIDLSHFAIYNVNVRHYITSANFARGVKISWKTNKFSDSLVEYGKDPQNLDMKVFDERQNQLSHSLELFRGEENGKLLSLEPNTIYYFRIKSVYKEDPKNPVAATEEDTYEGKFIFEPHNEQRAIQLFDQEFLRGDADNDGKIDLTDAVFLLNYLFKGGTAPQCTDAADANDDSKVDLTDAVYILSYLFQGGPEPPAPFGTEGEDLTADNLGCDCYGESCGNS